MPVITKFHFESENHEEAIAEFKKLVESREFYYLRLIHSCHPYSEGFWIETEIKPLHIADDVIDEYDGRAFMRNKQIDEILNE